MWLLKCQFFEAEYLVNEDSGFVPADVAAVIHSSKQETLRVRELRQLARYPDRAGSVATRWDLVIQVMMRPLVGEYITKVVEAALLRT